MSEIRYPWSQDAKSINRDALTDDDDTNTASKKPRGWRPANQRREDSIDLGANHGPEWLYNELLITGPEEELKLFAVAARGPGVTPWRINYDKIEEDIFNIAVSRPPPLRLLDIEGCRILARQFSERVAARQARANARIGKSKACPFDLQTIIPIPENVLFLGASDPKAIEWLLENWGTADGLRQVQSLEKPSTGKRLPGGHRTIGYSFFTINTSAEHAVSFIKEAWLGLRFTLRWRPLNWNEGWIV